MKNQYYAIGQTLVVVIAVAVLSRCSAPIPVNPWNVALDQCQQWETESQQRKCQLGVAIAREACATSVDAIECVEGVDPDVCATAQSALAALCQGE